MKDSAHLSIPNRFMALISRTSFIVLLLSISTIVTYIGLHQNTFLVNFDDFQYILDNPRVTTGLRLSNIRWSLTSFYASNWHPLTWISHMIDWQIHGPHAGGHLLSNLLLHLFNTLLLFFFMKGVRFGPWPAALVAGLFSLHPLHIESVAWIAERKDLLSTFFGLMALLAWNSSIRGRRGARYLLALLLYALSLMAKPMFVTLPFLLLLFDYWPLNRSRWSPGNKIDLSFGTGNPSGDQRGMITLLVEKVPFFALSLFSCILTFWAQWKGSSVTTLEALPLSLRLANTTLSYLRYLGHAFWPARLSIIYPFIGTPPQGESIAAAITLLLITLLCLILWKKKPWLIVGWFWYIGTLVPVIGLVQVGAQSMADRYTYFPLTGIFMILACFLRDLYQRFQRGRLALVTLTAVILLTLGVQTGLQLHHWRDGETIFRHALEVTRDNYIAHNNLGIILIKKKLFKEAYRHFLLSLSIKDDYTLALNNAAIASLHLDECHRAFQFMERSLVLKPHDAEAHFLTAITHEKCQQQEEAILRYQKTLLLDSTSFKAANNLGILYLRRDDFDQALDLFIRATRIDPDALNPRLNRVKTLLALGRIDDANRECGEIRGRFPASRKLDSIIQSIYHSSQDLLVGKKEEGYRINDALHEEVPIPLSSVRDVRD